MNEEVSSWEKLYVEYVSIFKRSFDFRVFDFTQNPKCRFATKKCASVFYYEKTWCIAYIETLIYIWNLEAD